MDDVFPALAGHNDTPLTVFESQFHRISQTGAHVFLDNQPVNDQIDTVLFILIQFRCFIEGVNFLFFTKGRHPHPHKTVSFQFFKPVLMRAFLHFHKRREQNKP